MALELGFDDDLTAAAWVDVVCAEPGAGVSLVPGVEGQAARFDGSGACIDVEHVDGLPLERGFTIESWINVEEWHNPKRDGAPIETVVSHSDDFWIAVIPGEWSFDAGLRSGGDRIALRAGSVRLGAWQHVALVREDSSDFLRLYVDGRVVAQREVKGALQLQPGIPVRVGTWFRQNQAFCGMVDSLRIWERAFSADEMRSRFESLRRDRSE